MVAQPLRVCVCVCVCRTWRVTRSSRSAPSADASLSCCKSRSASPSSQSCSQHCQKRSTTCNRTRSVGRDTRPDHNDARCCLRSLHCAASPCLPGPYQGDYRPQQCYQDVYVCVCVCLCLLVSQIHSFYEAVGLMIGAESESQKRDEYLVRTLLLQAIPIPAQPSPPAAFLYILLEVLLNSRQCE